MIRTPAPFPQPGSYALLVDLGQTHIVRILSRVPDAAEAVISFPARWGASGNKTVPLADLIDGTPLTADERREMRHLFEEADALAAGGRAHRQRLAEANALRQRDIHSETLERLKGTLPSQLRRAA
jgi:hypothetical protein